MSEETKTIKTFSREDLYQRLWKAPITRVAVELGYSYVELVKICTDLRIPRPPPGYWYRLQHGAAPEQVPLPPIPEGTQREVQFGRRLGAQPPPGPSIHVGESDECKASTAPTIRQQREVPQATAAATSNESTAESTRFVAPTRAAPNFPDAVRMTREELYRHVWTTPMQLLSEALGLSDVGLAKTCRQMEVPTPGRGYWARLDSGQSVDQIRLPPPSARAVRHWTFNVAANRQRREYWAVTKLSAPMNGNSLFPFVLPGEQEPLHEVAERHRAALEKAKLDVNGFVSLDLPTLFRCEVSARMTPRLVRAIHALVAQLEKCNCRFVRGDSELAHLNVAQGDGRLTVRWREILQEFEREPTTEEKRKPSWTWQLKEKRGSGRLTVEVSAIGLRGQRSWTESESRPIEEVLARVMEKIAAVFDGLVAQRQREAELQRQAIEQEKKRAEFWAKREEERKEQQRIAEHQSKLREVERIRRFNLGVAAQQWEDSERVFRFVDAVESRWRSEPPVELSLSQREWLSWARAEAKKLAPWSNDYPDADSATACNPKAIPNGGPYPEMRRLKPHEFRNPDPKPEPPPHSQYFGPRY